MTSTTNTTSSANLYDSNCHINNITSNNETSYDISDSNCDTTSNGNKYSLPDCQEYYVRRVQYLEQFRQQHGRDIRRRYLTLAKEIRAQSPERFMEQMGRLKSEMIDLMEKDVYLMRQLLTLSDSVAELRLEDAQTMPLPTASTLTRTSSLSSSVPSLTTEDMETIILPVSATKIKIGANHGALCEGNANSSSPFIRWVNPARVLDAATEGGYCSADSAYCIRSTEDLTEDSDGVSRRHAILRIPIEPAFTGGNSIRSTLLSGKRPSSRPRRTLTCDSNGSSDGGSSTSSSGVSSGGSRSVEGTVDDFGGCSSSDETLKAGEEFRRHSSNNNTLTTRDQFSCANCIDDLSSPYRTKFLLAAVSGDHCSKNCIKVTSDKLHEAEFAELANQNANQNQNLPPTCPRVNSIDNCVPTRIILRKKSSSSSRKKVGKTTLMSFDDSDVSILTLTDPQEVFI